MATNNTSRATCRIGSLYACHILYYLHLPQIYIYRPINGEKQFDIIVQINETKRSLSFMKFTLKQPFLPVSINREVC